VDASVWVSTPVPADSPRGLRFPVYTGRDLRFLIYWGGQTDSLPLVFRVRQGDTPLLEDRVVLRQSPTALRFPLKHFPNGLFVLDVQPVGTEQVRSTSFYVFRFDRMSERELRMTVELLRYVMDDHAVRAFQDASADHRGAVWDSLWAALDPDPTTAVNEVRDRFEARILYVNHAFRYANIPGVLTDRGRTYLKFGPPDEIDRHPFDFDSVPYEIWYYEQPVRRVFYFVDRKGIGDYVLVDPQRFDLFRP
ncbi:MAG: GWxTD domain-containing protein, partial [Candidatus Hydrothermae bacterium]|nr:GWxTD domain-containing protein [Candidatus Hydrothermae bacterium]